MNKKNEKLYNMKTKTRKAKTYNRRVRRLIRSISLSAVVVLIVCILSILCHKTISSASTEVPKEKYYKSVEIQPGDSLWSIAKENYTEEWDSIQIYIEEIKEFNGIYNDEIQSGNYLSIPYYEKNSNTSVTVLNLNLN